MAYIHKEGRRIILFVFILLLVLNFLLYLAFPSFVTLQLIIGVISLMFLVFVLAFFRNPSRDLPNQETKVIAPADGKVVAIEEVMEEEFFKEKRLLVSIFMSVKNIHVNRNPISGKVKYVKYHPGKYLVAWHPKSSTENERTSIVIEKNNFDILIRQIAGAVARRIVYYLKEGDEVMQGKELGFIKFGSRVDLYLPIGTVVDVKLNQKVKGGKTIVAHI